MVFDIDGTLLQSASVDDALYRESVRAILGPVRLRDSLHDYERVTDSGILQQILADNSIPSTREPLEGVRSHFVEAVRTYVDRYGPFREIPGAGDYLRSLRASPEHAVAIATGGWGDSARIKLTSAGIAYADIPVASSDDAHDRTEIMRIALASIGQEFESVTYFGDGPWDRDACERLGWSFVAVGPELDGLESFRGLQIP
jgi:phosphoglycolate phosphatase-like HAD superfamily hydrolase